MLDFTRSGLPNVSQSKSKFTTFLWSDNCSLFTDYTNLPSHNLCGSCDLASKLSYVTGDELEIDVSIELFRNQTILRWCRCLCGYSSYASILI